MIYGDINNPPPFYENWDDVHCMECTMRSVLQYFEPDREFTRDNVNKLTNKIEGKCSWPYFCMKSLLDNGYKIKFITPFGIHHIIEKGFKYHLINTQGEENAVNTIAISPPIDDIETACAEIINHKNLIEIEKISEVSDIRDMLKDGYLINSMIDARALNKRDGYNGHSVLIYAMDDTHIYFHDSGLPPIPNRKETIEFFVQCATTPKDTNWFMIGFKK